MHYSLKLAAATAVLGLCVAQASGDLLSYWHFNTTAPTNTTRTYAAGVGSGSLSLTSYGGTVTSFGGTPTNATGGQPAGNDLTLQAGTNLAGNGTFMQYSLSTAGFQDLVLTYAQRRSTSGFSSNVISYSTNGTNFTTHQTISDILATEFGVQTVDFSSVSALDNQGTVFVRFTFSGATSSLGSNRFDNIQFNASPVAAANDTSISASPLSVDFGRVHLGASLASSISLTKAGSASTGYSISLTGDATSSSTGGAFEGGAGSDSFDVGATTSTVGVKSGSAVVDNLATDSFGPGLGSADGDDTIAVAATVVASAEPSFSPESDQNLLVLDFGPVANGSTSDLSFSIENLASTFGESLTAGLDLDDIQLDGPDEGALTTDLSLFQTLLAGDSAAFRASFSPTADSGSFTEQYTLSLSDEDLPGDEAMQTLTLVLQGTAVPEPSGLWLLSGVMLPLLRRQGAVGGKKNSENHRSTGTYLKAGDRA